EEFGRDIRDHEAMLFHDHPPRVRDKADFRPGQIPFIENALHFILAAFFGSLAYWLLQISRQSHRTFSYRVLPGWFVALATLYGFFLFFSLIGS
ncbi:MAG: hypothetical protein ABI747_02585, partial [Candidatus Moraniibacteriota bacterium]